MSPRTKWFILRKKVFVSCLIAAGVYFVLTFILIHFNFLSTQEFLSSTIDEKNEQRKYDSKTTTTTTPTPLIFFNNVKNILTPGVVIEKFDAMKVHADIMKRRIDRMVRKQYKSNQPLNVKENMMNDTVHLFYSNNFNKEKREEKKGWELLSFGDRNATYKMIKQNVETARRCGAGALFVTCSRLSNSLISQTSRVHTTLKMLFHLGPKHGLKVGMAIKDYTKRNVMSIRRDIRIFLSMYGKERALFKFKSINRSHPVIYVFSSYTIPSDEWSEVLSSKGKFTIRNTKLDSIILGELRDEEHISHIRQSHFDGFFTSPASNGEVFGSTWKNWQTMATWARDKGLLWSSGIVELSAGLPAVGVALRTALRCRPRPSFVSLTNVPLIDEYFTLTQTWLRSWSNRSLSDI